TSPPTSPIGSSRPRSRRRSSRSTRARGSCRRRRRAGAVRSTRLRRSGSVGAIWNARTSRLSRPAWRPRAAIRGSAASSTRTPRGSRASRRAIPDQPTEGSLMTALEGLGYAFDPLDRASALRENAAALAALRARPDARAVLIARDMPVLHKGAAGLEPLLPIAEVEALGGARAEALLGILPGGAPVFAALMPDDAVIEESDSSDGFLDRRVLVVPGRED